MVANIPRKEFIPQHKALPPGFNYDSKRSYAGAWDQKLSREAELHAIEVAASPLNWPHNYLESSYALLVIEAHTHACHSGRCSLRRRRCCCSLLLVLSLCDLSRVILSHPLLISAVALTYNLLNIVGSNSNAGPMRNQLCTTIKQRQSKIV